MHWVTQALQMEPKLCIKNNFYRFTSLSIVLWARPAQEHKLLKGKQLGRAVQNMSNKQFSLRAGLII